MYYKFHKILRHYSCQAYMTRGCRCHDLW